MCCSELEKFVGECWAVVQWRKASGQVGHATRAWEVEGDAHVS